MILNFLSYILDFTIQFIFLCHLIIPWKDNKIKIILYILITSTLVTCAQYFGFINILRVTIHAYLFFTILIIFKIRPIRLFLINFLSTYIFNMTVQTPLVLILSFIYPSILVNRKLELLIMVMYTLAAYIFCKKVPISKIVNNNIKVLEKYSILLAGIVLNVILANYINYNYNEIPLLLIIVTLINIILIYVFYKVNVENQEEKLLIRSYEQNAKELVPLLNEIKGTQHDFKNHLATIYGLCHEGNSEKHIENYIEKVNESLKSVDLILHIKNKVIGAIIYSKLCKANSENIQFEYEYPPHDVSFPLKEYEYASVISNLLDNAFEAPCNKEKIVKLTIGTENERNFIKVSNNGEPIPMDLVPKIFKKGYSTKEKKSGHGFGLYNIKKITKGYGGSIEVFEEGEFTVFNICFNGPKCVLVPQS